MKQKPRSFAPDLIRTFALFSVICVHFFLNSGYYTVPLAGRRMLAMTLVRSFFMICVPLFIMLSGYLMSQKKLQAKYYLGLIKTVSLYILASIVCYIFKVHHFDATFSFRKLIVDTLQYNAAPYAWYVEMYLGLFMLIPFLNICYNGIETRRGKLALVVTMLSLTAFQSVLNSVFDIYPDFWIDIYPISYYFIGCYLREFPIKLKTRYLALLTVACDLAFGLFSFVRCRGELFKWGVWQLWGSIGVVSIAVLVFSILSRASFKNASRPTARVISRIFAYTSKWSFGAYLVSYIFDTVVYARLNSAIPNVTSRAIYMPLAVGAVFVCSLLLSAVLNLAYSAIYSAVSSLIRLIGKKKSAEVSQQHI